MCYEEDQNPRGKAEIWWNVSMEKHGQWVYYNRITFILTEYSQMHWEVFIVLL